MDKSALEWHFDNSVANVSSEKTEKEEVNKDEGLDENEKLFLSLLPDELLAFYKDDTAGSSQNSTAAAKLAGGSSVPQPAASSVQPTTSMMTVAQQLGVIPQIHNVVSSAMLGCRLDLKLIACKAWNTEYNPKKCRRLIMRIREPRTTALIFSTGTIVCYGAKSVEQSRLAARRFARKVQKLGFPARFLNFKIHNLMATWNTFPIYLEQLARHQPCSYEPELFAGVLYKVKPGITVTIMTSGKISLTGAKKEADIYEVIEILYPIMSCFRK